ncbi:MAG: DUF4031 domain-containing protein [Gammaproteobacteria bacterium]
MTVYVDDFAHRVGNRIWFHMMADTDTELHRFADDLGLKREWYHNDHYDITSAVKSRALRKGAQQVTAKFLVELRKRKRRGALPITPDREDLRPIRWRSGDTT